MDCIMPITFAMQHNYDKLFEKSIYSILNHYALKLNNLELFLDSKSYLRFINKLINYIIKKKIIKIYNKKIYI